MKNLLVLSVIALTSCSTKTIEQKKIRKEKAIVLSSMAIYGIGMKVIADKQSVIK